MIKANCNIKDIISDINKFKAIGVYPIEDFTKFPGYNLRNYKIYRILFNNKITLYFLYFCYKLIKIFK